MTFANRKVARIARQQAEAGKTFKYRVRCDAFHIPGGVSPVLPGLFANKADAERFAFEKIPGAPVGYTAALRAINAAIPSKFVKLPDGTRFVVERVEI